jgi:hypothetical protein
MLGPAAFVACVAVSATSFEIVGAKQIISTLLLAYVDSILQSIIANGYLGNFIVFHLGEKFKNLSAIYGLYFFLIRLISIVFIDDIGLIFSAIIISKLIAIFLLHNYSKSNFVAEINPKGTERFTFRDSYSYNTVLSIVAIFIISADRIIGNISLSSHEMAQYFLTFQYISAIGSLCEQYIVLNFRTIVLKISTSNKLSTHFTFSTVIMAFASLVISFLAKAIYAFSFVNAFNIIFFQFSIVILWLFYLVLILSLNSNSARIGRNSLLHLIGLAVYSFLWFFAYVNEAITLSNLGTYVYLGLNFLLTLMLFFGSDQIPSSLRQKLVIQLLLYNLLSLLFTIFEFEIFQQIIRDGLIGLVVLQLVFTKRLGERSAK